MRDGVGKLQRVDGVVLQGVWRGNAVCTYTTLEENAHTLSADEVADRLQQFIESSSARTCHNQGSMICCDVYCVLRSASCKL